MSPSTWVSALISVAGFLAQAPLGTDGHLYMMNPISRQLWGTTAFSESNSPHINYCPHCFQSRGPGAIRERAGGAPWPHLNGKRAPNGNYIESDKVAKRHGVCGDPEQTAAEGSNAYGQENSEYPVIETHSEGGVLEVKILVSTYHWGHIEMFICNADDLPGGPDSVVTQSCFNKYPLDRASDDEDKGGPIDPNYPGRYFLDPPCRADETDQTMVEGAYPGQVATARYQLPPGLTCPRCVVQMAYYTGNSCKHQGYAEFDAPSWPSSCAPSKGDWINEAVSQCGEGSAYPEEFWNCADIEITSGGDTNPSPTPPSPQPTPETEKPVEAVIATPSPVDSDDETMAPAPTFTDDGGSDDDYEMPTSSDDDYEMPTSSDYDDSDDDYEMTVPTPEPFDEPTPETSTLAPATFAPSAASPIQEGDNCEELVEAYEQCGGTGYDGSTCCRAGYECSKLAACYSECRPIEGGCSEGWGQCGGTGWDGPECCWPGAECFKRSDFYSQCVPETAT